MGIRVGSRREQHFILVCTCKYIKWDKLENNTDNFKFFEIFIGDSKKQTCSFL